MIIGDSCPSYIGDSTSDATGTQFPLAAQFQRTWPPDDPPASGTRNALVLVVAGGLRPFADQSGFDVRNMSLYQVVECAYHRCGDPEPQGRTDRLLPHDSGAEGRGYCLRPRRMSMNRMRLTPAWPMQANRRRSIRSGGPHPVPPGTEKANRPPGPTRERQPCNNRPPILQGHSLFGGPSLPAALAWRLPPSPSPCSCFQPRPIPIIERLRLNP